MWAEWLLLAWARRRRRTLHTEGRMRLLTALCSWSTQRLSVSPLSLQKVLVQLSGQTALRHEGWGGGDGSGCSARPGSDAWHLRSGLASFARCPPRSQSAIRDLSSPHLTLPSRLCPAVGFLLWVQPQEMGWEPDRGCAVAVPDRCSDWMSLLSPSATPDDSALPPSARSPSGTWGPCQPQEGPVPGLGVVGCQHPLFPKSCLSSVPAGQSFAEMPVRGCSSSTAEVTALRAASWGLPRCGCWLLHDPSHRSYA